MMSIFHIAARIAGCDLCGHCEPKEECYYVGVTCANQSGCPPKTISVPCAILDGNPFWPSRNVIGYGGCCYDMSTVPQTEPQGEIITQSPSQWQFTCDQCEDPPPPDNIACCYLNGICIEQTPHDCQQFGGFAQGPGSTCSPNPCTAGSCDSCDNWPASVTVSGQGFGFVCPNESADCQGDLLQSVPLNTNSCRYEGHENPLNVVNEICNWPFPPPIETRFTELFVQFIECGQGNPGTPSEGWGKVWRIEVRYGFVINDGGGFGTSLVRYFRPVFPSHNGPPLGVYAFEQDLTANPEPLCGPDGDIFYPSTVSVI